MKSCLKINSVSQDPGMMSIELEAKNNTIISITNI